MTEKITKLARRLPYTARERIRAKLVETNGIIKDAAKAFGINHNTMGLLIVSIGLSDFVAELRAERAAESAHRSYVSWQIQHALWAKTPAGRESSKRRSAKYEATHREQRRARDAERSRAARLKREAAAKEIPTGGNPPRRRK